MPCISGISAYPVQKNNYQRRQVEEIIQKHPKVKGVAVIPLQTAREDHFRRRAEKPTGKI